MAEGDYWQLGKSLAETNMKMLESGLGSDVAFKVGEVGCHENCNFRAHKYMLVSRSPVFETMFYGSIAETSEIVQIPDIQPHVFHLLLRYIYSEISEFDDIQSALDTVYASKKYMITTLTSLAVTYILGHITVDNVCLVLEHCQRLDEETIVKKCYDFINNNATLIVSKDAFCFLSETSIAEVVSSESIYVLEEHLLSGLISWSCAQLKKRLVQTQPVDACIKNEIKDFLPLLRFPLIAFDKLMSLNSKYGLLSPTDMNQIFEYQHGRLHPAKCKYNTNFRGTKSCKRFSLSTDVAVLNLVRKDEMVKRKFQLEFWPQTPNLTLTGVNLMNGPYIVKLLVYDNNNQLVSYMDKDFTNWPEKDACKETTFVLQEPVECEISDDPHRIEVYLSKSNTMYWYDKVIVAKFSGNSDLKIKFYNPEIVSKIFYLLG